MHAATLFLALLLPAADPGPAPAAAPKAFLSGPLTSRVGEKVWLDPTGSSSSSASLRMRVARGPERAPVQMLYTKDGALVYAYAVPSKAGNYEFVLVAPGPDRDGDEFAFWTVAVVDQEPPAPPPQPLPTPAPAPAPAPSPAPPPPAPAPVPPATKLIAVGVYTADTTSADELAFAAVRDDPGLRQALAALNVQWHAYDLGSPELDRYNIRPYLAASGPFPQLVVYDTAGTFYDAAGRPVGKPKPASVKAPLTPDAMRATFKTIRGAN